jgi:hypothetical protein
MFKGWKLVTEPLSPEEIAELQRPELEWDDEFQALDGRGFRLSYDSLSIVEVQVYPRLFKVRDGLEGWHWRVPRLHRRVMGCDHRAKQGNSSTGDRQLAGIE